MTKQQVIKAMYRPYFEISINEKINARQRRNGLNINYLYGTTMDNVGRGYLEDKDYSHPVINNGLYHHIGKTHSKYPTK